jgi:monoamine oxidase
VVGATADKGAAWFTGILSAVLGRPCPDPTAAVVTSWSTDPYTFGAYTHVPPGANPGLTDLLGTPLHGRILFAGEHTQSARMGYADGALTSGIREAKRLLARPAVVLGPA